MHCLKAVIGLKIFTLDYVRDRQAIHQLFTSI